MEKKGVNNVGEFWQNKIEEKKEKHFIFKVVLFSSSIALRPLLQQPQTPAGLQLLGSLLTRIRKGLKL